MANKSELFTTLTETRTGPDETSQQDSESSRATAAEFPAEPLTTGANRRNAQLSSGPRTPEGKKTRSRNATTHGLLIQDVLINAGAGKENALEFEALLADLGDAYQPVGIVEDLLVRELAISYWRSARALRSERGAVTQGTTIWRENPELNELEEKLLDLQGGILARHTLLASSRGVNHLLRKIEDLKAQVKVSPSVLVESFRWLSPDKNWRSFPNKTSLLVALENETEELIKVKAQIEQEEADQKQARLESSAIPSLETLHRIQRDENSNVRHRYRVEHRLQELQSRRKAAEKPVSENGGRPN